jgi:hypothetical protein
MCCEGLMCAACGGPVIEAHCPVCRNAKAHVHASNGPSVQLLGVILAMLTILAMLFAHHYA